MILKERKTAFLSFHIHLLNHITEKHYISTNYLHKFPFGWKFMPFQEIYLGEILKEGRKEFESWQTFLSKRKNLPI